MNSKYYLSLFLFAFPLLLSAQEFWFLSATNLEASPGSQVCLDINAHPSSAISSFQFTMDWDASVIDYVSVTTADLPSNPQYGTNFIEQGNLLVSWFTASPYEVTERTTLLTVCFDVVGELDDFTPLTFTSEFTEIEVTNPNFEPIPLEFIPGSVLVTGIPTGGNKLTAGAVIESPSCLNNAFGQIQLFVEGGTNPINVSWTGPDNFASTSQHISDLTPGQYTATIMDGVGFSLIDSFVVENLIPTVDSAVVKDVQCFGQLTGSINITLSGGVEPYSFEWSNASQFEDLSSLGPGVYEVTITDDNDCSATYSYTINEPAAISLAMVSSICPDGGEENGAAEFIASGGVGNYEYFWSTGAQNSSGVLGDLANGEYMISVTDDNNCPFVSESFSLEVGIAAIQDSYTICGGQSVELSLDAPNATAFSWEPTDILSCMTCANPVVSTTEDTVVTVTITNPSGCMASADVAILTADDCVWPGDANNDGVANFQDVLWIGLGANATGPLRENASTVWAGAGAEDWTSETPVSMVNYKFMDCDGNGTIDGDDVDVILLNYEEMHGFSGESDDRGLGAPFLVDLPTEVDGGASYDFDLLLGDSNDAIAGAFGLTFTINYDQSLVDIGNIDLTLDGWFGDNSGVVYEINRKTPGKIEIGWVRNDGQSMSGAGKVGSLAISFNEVSADTPFNIVISNPKLINISEGEIEVDGSTNTTLVKDLIDAVDLPIVAEDNIYPNPASDRLVLDINRIITDLRIYSSTGVLLNAAKAITREMDISEWNSGIYFIELTGPEGVSTHRLVVKK